MEMHETAGTCEKFVKMVAGHNKKLGKTLALTVSGQKSHPQLPQGTIVGYQSYVGPEVVRRWPESMRTAEESKSPARGSTAKQWSTRLLQATAVQGKTHGMKATEC